MKLSDQEDTYSNPKSEAIFSKIGDMKYLPKILKDFPISPNLWRQKANIISITDNNLTKEVEFLYHMQNIMKKKNLPFLTAKHLGRNENIICIKQPEGEYKYYNFKRFNYIHTQERDKIPIKINFELPNFLKWIMPSYEVFVNKRYDISYCELIPNIDNSQKEPKYNINIRNLPVILSSEIITSHLENSNDQFIDIKNIEITESESNNESYYKLAYISLYLENENFEKYYNNLKFWQKTLLNLHYIAKTGIIWFNSLITDNLTKTEQLKPTRSEEISVLSSQNSQNSSVNLDSQQKKGDHNIS